MAESCAPLGDMSELTVAQHDPLLSTFRAIRAAQGWSKAMRSSL